MATKFRAGGDQVPAAQNQFIYNNAPQTNDQMEFAFRKRFEKIDWRRIASADVGHIARTLDFDTLQDNIANIAFCDIEQELDMQIVDPNYVKLFQLSQLTIEYLLHSQDYLMRNLQETQSFVATLTDELNKTKSSTEALQKELSAVKAESHKRKKIITTQQMLLQNGGEAYNRCAFCSKAFINQTFLEAHVHKRHAGKLAAQRAMESPAVVHVTSAPVPSNADTVELDAIRKRLQHTESRLAQEVEARNVIEDKLKANAAEVERKMREEITAWQENVRAEHERDLQRYMRELTETNEKLRIAEAALQKKMESPLDNFEMMELRRQREDNALFREELLAQKAELEKREAELMRKNLKDFDTKLKLSDGADTMQDIFIQSPSHAAPRIMQNDRPASLDGRKSVPPQAAKLAAQSDRNSQQRGRDREIEREASRAASGLKDVASIVAEMSDGEIESEDESATFTGRTLPTYDGNLSLTDDGRQEKLRRELEQNPDLVKSAREQGIFELEAALEKRGIRRGTSSISDQLFGTLTNSLKTERTKLAKDIKNFYDIRNQFMNLVDSNAKAKHAATVSSAAATPQSARSVPSGPAVAPVAGQSATAAAALPAQRSSVVTDTGAGQPRVASTNNNNRTGTTMSNTRQSATSATLADSTTFTSGASYSHSDSFGSDTEADLTVSRDQSPPASARRDAGAQAKTGGGSQAARATSAAIPPPGLDRADLSDFDEDSMSELEAAAKPVSRPVSMPPSAAPSATGPRLGIGVGHPASGLARGGNINHNNSTPRSARNSDEMSLRTVSSIDDAGVNAPQPTYSSIYRQPAQSSKLPSTSSSFKGGKSLGNSVRFSDELESIGDD